MTPPKIRFCWRPTATEGARWRLGLFCFYDARAKSAGRMRAWRLLISLRGLSAWFAVFVVAAYFAGAGVLGWWFARRPFNQVTYADLVCPTHWSQLREKRGRALIAEGLDDFKKQKWREGEAALRVGLARAPAETAARLELARFYLAINQRARAKQALDGGFAYGYPGRDYFRQACQTAAEAEDYDWWVAMGDAVLAQLADKPGFAAERKEALLQKMTALMANRPQEVLRLAETAGDKHDARLDEFKALALLKLGRSADAVVFLGDWRRRKNGSQVIRLQARAFRESGRMDEMERALGELCADDPASPLPYIYGIVQRLLAARRAQAEQGLADFLFRFGSSPEFLYRLADPLAEIGERAMLERLINYARQQGFDLAPFQRASITAMIGQGDWSQARALLADIRLRGETIPPVLEFWYVLMERLCDAALDPAGGTQSSLTELARDRRLSLKTDRLLIESLRRAGRPATARDFITSAQGSYPDNATLTTWRDELDRELAAIQTAQAAVVLPKAPVAVVVRARAPARAAVKESEFVQGLADAKKTGDFTGALRQIREVREARPDWLVAREDEIEAEEIYLNGRLGDLAALHLANGFYLNGDILHARKAVELARELYAAGCKEEAVFLARDILRKTPDYAPPKRLLSEWEPKPVAPAP